MKLFNGPNDLDKKSRGIVQQYIKNPYLLNGRKFTIRLYAVYTSLKPARIYVYPEGFCHIATEKYSSNVKEIKNRYMHITNPDISGKRDFYKKNPSPYYWSISEMRNYMRKHNVDDDKLWGEMKVLVAKTLLSGIDNLKKYSRKIKISNEFDIMKQQNCFELIEFISSLLLIIFLFKSKTKTFPTFLLKNFSCSDGYLFDIKLINKIIKYLYKKKIYLAKFTPIIVNDRMHGESSWAETPYKFFTIMFSYLKFIALNIKLLRRRNKQ